MMVKQEYITDWVLRAQKIAHLGIWDQDPISNELWWSDETFRILGLNSETTAPSFDKFLQMVHPDDRAFIVKHTELALKSDDNPYKIEYRIMRPDKSERILHEEALIERDDKGTPIKITGIIQDITESKRAEEEKRKMEAQLLQSHKMEAIGTLAGGIAHEFNNALSVITGNIDLLKMDLPDNEIVYNYTKPMMDSSDRITKLTAQLLAYARGGKYQAKTISINELVKDTLALLQHTLNHNIKVETNLAAENFNVKADPTQVQMLVSAILANASEAIEGEGFSPD